MYPRERERKKKKVNKVIRPEDVKSTADKLRYAEQEGKKISQLQGAEKEQAYKKAYDNLSIKPSQVEFEQAYNEVFDEYIKPRAKRDYIPGQATQPTLKNQKVNDIFSGGKYVLDNLGTGFESGMHNIYGAVGKTLAKPGTLIDSILDIPQTMQDNALKNVTQLQQEKMGSDFNDFYNKQVASGNTKIKDAVEEINNPGIRKETINPFEQYDIYNDVKEGIDNHALSETLNENADYHLNKAIEKQANLYGRYDQDTINKPTEFLGSVAQGVGGMIPSLATGAVTGNPSAALGVMGVGAYGGGVGQALSEGAELEDAFMYGIANAVTEVATERIVGGLPLLGSGISDDLINQVVGKLSNNPTTKNILEKVADVLGEGFEEYLSEVIGEFTTDIYSNEKTNQDIFDRFGNVQSDALMAGLVGMGTAGVLNAPGYISNFQGKSDVEIDNELNSMSNEDLADLEQQLSNETNINEQIPTELETSVQKPLNAQLEDIENINNEEKILRLTQEQYDNLPVEPSELEADGTRIVITDKMLISDDANIALNAQRVNKENIELQSKGLWDEKVINTMAKLSNKSGIPYEITELNSNINGMYYDGKIFINKKSDNPLLTAYLHELTHGIEGTKSYDGVVQAIKNHINYSGVVEDVDFLIEQDIYQTIEDRKAYGQNLTYEQAESEVIAEYMQQFASDENFINEISNDKNLIQRIIAWLKETVSNLTGTKEQKAYNELIKKYEQAIKEVKQGNVNRSSNIQFDISKPYSEVIEDIYTDKYVNEIKADIKQGKKDINSPKNISLGVKVPGFTNIIKNESKNLMGYQGSELESKLTDVVKEIVDIGSISNESRQMILNAVKEKSGTVTDTFKNDLTNYLKENNISGIKIDSNLNDYFKRMKMQGISTINKELPFGIYFTTNKNGKSINDVYNALMKQYPNEFSKISEKVLPEYDMFNNIKNYLTKKQDVAFNKDNNIELSEDEINDKITQFEASVKAKIKNREKITRAFHNDENIVIKTKDKVAQKLGLQDDIETKYTKDMEVYVKEYGRIKQGENAARTIYVPKATEQGTVKQHYRTILESPQATKETIEALQGEIINGKATYKPISNEELISNTRDKANRLGETTLYDDFMKSEKISSQGIADGEYLLNKALRTNNVEQTLSLSEKLASMLNETGRALQAARILKRLTPEGQITILQRDVIKLNEQIKNKPGGKLNENMAKLTGTDLDKLNKLAKNEIVLDPKLVEKFMSAETETERADIMNELQTNIAKQIPSTLSDKVNQWRYLAMLGNPRTHIRNIVGNMVFQPVVGMKNVIATGLEKVAANTKAFKDMEKTKSILTPKDNELVKWANEDFKKFKIAFSKTEKYGINRDIQGKRDIFTSKYLGTTLNKLSNWNSNLLDFEDELFTKYRYAQSLAEQMKANKVTPETVSEDMLIKMQDRAYQEALESVYRDANSLANALNKLRHTNKYTKYAVDAVMPFTKTPMNIVKRSVEYSPIGLVKEITKGTYDVMDGKITPDEYINGLSKGLTGSALAALGFFMASIGSLRTDDEDKDRLNAYERDLGEQDYSLILPNGDSYTLDWLSPSIAPMGIGVELFNLAKEKTNNKDLVGSLLDSATTVFNPIMETSMLSGLSSSLKSYDDNNLAGVVKNAVFSYVGQFFPTLGGQVARILDDKRRNTYSDTVLGRQVNVIKNKIPGLASTNEPYINKKGEYEYTGNLLERIVGNMLSPGYYKKNTKDSYDEELIRLFKLNEYENSSVLPTTYSSFTNDKVKYKFDSKDYTITNKRYAETLRTETKKFIDSSVYQGLSDDERVEVISKIQAYSQQKAKGVFFSDMDMVQKNVKFADYFKKNGSNIYSYYLNSNIKSLVDDTGKTIKNSKATQARANLEKLGIYDNIVSDYEKGNLSVDDLGYFGLNKTVLGYDEYEFNHKYNDIVSNGYESKEKSDQDIYEEIFN